jgi:predicted dehydrogenase
MSKIRAVIVGCGGRSRAHIDAYKTIPEAGVTACCAPTPVRRDPLAVECGIKAYSDIEVMLREEKPDIVHLVTHPETRVALMSAVSAAEVPLCTVEKPVAVGVRDWRALCELAAATRTKFAVCHQFRWQKHLAKCQEAMRGGRLGLPLFLDISAGMNIANQGTHILNYGRSLIGDPQVSSVVGNVFGWDRSDTQHPAPEAASAYLTFENGVRASWVLGPIAPRVGDPETTWQHVRAAAYADLGRVNYEEFGEWAIVTGGERESGSYGGMDAWRQNNLAAQSAFHRQMLTWGQDEGQVPGTNLEISLHEWKAVLALYTSALEHRAVEVDTFEPADDLFERLEKMVG